MLVYLTKYIISNSFNNVLTYLLRHIICVVRFQQVIHRCLCDLKISGPNFNKLGLGVLRPNLTKYGNRYILRVIQKLRVYLKFRYLSVSDPINFGADSNLSLRERAHTISSRFPLRFTKFRASGFRKTGSASSTKYPNSSLQIPWPLIRNAPYCLADWRSRSTESRPRDVSDRRSTSDGIG